MDYIIATFLGWLSSKWQGKEVSGAPREMKFITQLLACMVCGFVPEIWDLVTTGDFQWDQILSYAATSFAASQTYYNLYFYKKG